VIPKRIFLVGLPGSGKTTIGKRLSENMGFKFIDLDEEIIKSEGSPITEIFAKKGEDYFRKVEHEELVKSFSTNQSIISTGGGAPCFHGNMELMNLNGLTAFIDTPITIIQERIQHDTSRPLMQSNTLEKLYEKRIEWYSMAKISAQSFEQLLSKIKAHSD